MNEYPINSERKVAPKMGKLYSSVPEMVRDLSEDKEQGERAADRLERRNIINDLIGARIARGLSQNQMAERMGCTQSKVSKFENGKDDDLRIGDFHKYTDALGLEMTICLSKKGRTMADRARSQVTATCRLIERLAQWVKHEDDAIAHGAEVALINTAEDICKTLLGAINQITRSVRNTPADDHEYPQISIESERPDHEPDNALSRAS
jgi:transcriptional regulator with XRE-family HTH domain